MSDTGTADAADPSPRHPAEVRPADGAAVLIVVATTVAAMAAVVVARPVIVPAAPAVR
jgi:hypothetical protein